MEREQPSTGEKKTIGIYFAWTRVYRSEVTVFRDAMQLQRNRQLYIP